MFFRKKKEYQKITEEQLRTVKRIQEIEKYIQGCRKDFSNLDNLGWYSTYNFNSERFYFGDEYIKILEKYIKEKIKKLEEEKEGLMLGDE